MSHKTFSHALCVTESGETVNNVEVLYKLEQERLEKLRQDAQLCSFIAPHQTSLRLRMANALRRWAYQLSPDLESEFVLARK